jgi:hypothetical protein
LLQLLINIAARLKASTLLANIQWIYGCSNIYLARAASNYHKISQEMDLGLNKSSIISLLFPTNQYKSDLVIRD